MSLLASSPLRHAFYETFLHIHIGAALTAFIFLWIHLKGSPARDYLLATLILWGAEVCFFVVHLPSSGLVPS